MSRTNETKNIKWHQTCKCECRLNSIAYNDKQRWNNDKCWCECKELIHKGVCDKDFTWNPSDFSEYLDYKNCTCKKRLANKLTEECNETIDEVKLTKISKITPAENENSSKHKFCILHIVLFSIFFIINVGISAYFVYYKYMNCSKKMFLDIMIMFIKQQFN